MYPNIENCCQLHERVEIHYYVDHYAANLVLDTDDGVVFTGHGPTVAAAMAALELELEGKTLDDIRGT